MVLQQVCLVKINQNNLAYQVTHSIKLADLKKGANLATQQQGIASGLNFLPAVAARQFTPEKWLLHMPKQQLMVVE